MDGGRIGRSRHAEVPGKCVAQECLAPTFVHALFQKRVARCDIPLVWPRTSLLQEVLLYLESAYFTFGVIMPFRTKIFPPFPQVGRKPVKLVGSLGVAQIERPGFLLWQFIFFGDLWQSFVACADRNAGV